MVVTGAGAEAEAEAGALAAGEAEGAANTRVACTVRMRESGLHRKSACASTASLPLDVRRGRCCRGPSQHVALPARGDETRGHVVLTRVRGAFAGYCA